MRQVAESWWQGQGQTIPVRDSQAYTEMYEKWIEFAFEGWDNGTRKAVEKRRKKETVHSWFLNLA
jgi:hypothetical protein